MINEVVLVGGWVFFAMLFAACAIIALVLGREMPGGAVFVASIVVLAMVLFTDAFKGARLQWLIALIVAYFIVACAWSAWKWYEHVIDRRDHLKEMYDQSKPADGSERESWESYSRKFRPQASENKELIMAWMVLWPFSMTWWLLTWPRKMFTWLYERMTTVFDRITDKVFGT